MNIPCPKGFDKNTWDNFQKIFSNEMEHYERNPPFNHPKTNWEHFLSLFWNIKIVRRLIGGKWVKGELGMWLQINDNFPEEWTKKHPYESY